MNEYRHLVESAVKNGAGEKAMWKAVDVVDELMCIFKKEHPDAYEKYMRIMSEAVYGGHYNEDMARADVEKMFHTDSKNVKHRGAHWSPDELDAATINMPFPSGTTTWDKYVAFNAAWHDFTNEFDDEDVIKLAYMFYFKDEDFAHDSKVWKYMGIN